MGHLPEPKLTPRPVNRSQPATLFLRPVTADDLIHDLHNNTKSSEYSKHTRSDMITSTGHNRLLYNPDRSLPTTLYAFYPVGSSPSEYTENTRLCIMTSTGHDRPLYNPDRSLPTTLYAFYPVGSSPSEYYENTRLCIMASTGHDRLLYLCSTQELGLRSIVVGT